MNPNLGIIGLARKGGMLAMGEEPTGAACRSYHAFAVFTAADAAANSIRRAEHFAQLGGVPHIPVSASKEELGAVCGRASLAMFALTDAGLALSAAKRLGWPLTKFNRKLDNVCEKLDRVGVRGLRGGRAGGAASNRRTALVEHAVSTLMVTAEDLPMLDEEFAANQAAKDSEVHTAPVETRRARAEGEAGG